MGRRSESYTVNVSLSNHNSDQDQEDEHLWGDLKSRVDDILNDPMYESIQPDAC